VSVRFDFYQTQGRFKHDDVFEGDMGEQVLGIKEKRRDKLRKESMKAGYLCTRRFYECCL
jgi:hypothetical protein